MNSSAKIEATLAKVDWDKVTPAEEARFTLAEELYLAQLAKSAQWRTSWLTASGSIVSMMVLAIVILLMKLTPATALEAILLTQFLRTGWLYWRAAKTMHEARALEADTITTLLELSDVHPFNGNQ
jgi:hypothetical protein